MKKQFVIVMVAIMLLSVSSAVTVFPVSAVTIDPDLEDEQLSPNNHFRIYYTDCIPVHHPNKCITGATVTTLGNDLEDIYDIYTDPSGDFQFNDPTRGTTMPVLIHPVNGYLGMAWTDVWIELAPNIFGDILTSRKTPLHEMLHEVQYTYGWPGGPPSVFVKEGTARMMQDKLYDDLDQSWGTELGAYFTSANDFLDSNTGNTLIDLSYRACLFWTYFTEQYGAVTNEPQVGVDVVRTVFEQYGAGSDDIQRVNAALNILSPGTTFQDVFMDFIVANYAKDLTGPSVPIRYQYLDDDRQPWAYHRPALTLDRDMAVGDIFSATDEIRAWSAKYYEARPSAGVPIISVDFHQPTASAVTLVYNLLVIKGDDLVMDVCEFNVMGRDFVRSIVNRDYDRVVVVVGALDHPAAFRYTVSTGGGIPTLNILWPRTGDPAQVDVDDLNTFHVHLEVVGPGGVVLSGLEPDDFQVTVDATDFNVVTGHEVMGQYWLVVQPEDLGAGTYDLQVSLAAGTLSDTEVNAVRFRDMVNADNVIVIDRSGSMLEPDWAGPYWEEPDPTDKIYGAIDAATLYINSFRTGDKIGLVWFSTDANTARTLRDFNEANRADFINRIDTFDEDESGAWRATSIGDGLWNAQDELDNRGAADHDWVIIVLSDGLENRHKNIDEVVCDGCKIDYRSSTTDPGTTKTVIHTVALGSNADCEKLEQLAHQSGGRFEYAIEPHSGDLPNDLADIYRVFAETVLLEQRIAAIRGKYSMSPPYPTHTINMEAGATEATFVVNYNWRGILCGGKPVVTLLDPSGKSVKPTYVDDTHHLFRISLPKSGSWTVKLEQPVGVEFCCEGRYLIEASVKSKATLEVFLGITPEERVIGAHLPIMAFLTDTQPITGATIDVEITTPELATAVAVLPSEINTLRLYDDGRHGDGKANDGVYGGTFRNTNRVGVYNMKVKAEGYSSLIGSFKRETRLAFNMRGDEDSDDDGLPDKWEKDHGLDPHNNKGDQGAKGDPDGDGLTNKEEFDIGTDPLDPDTDDGGENDGSENHAGRDPNDSADDKVRPPTSLRAIPGVNSVNLTIGYLPEHDYLIVYRASSPKGPWESFGIYPIESYTDGGLENDVTYYYKVVGVVQRERPYKSAPTRVVYATPKADPIPPSGYVVINDGAERTDTEDVTLMIWADPDTIEMKISNDPELTDATWESFNTAKSWTLLPGKGLRTVYVLFKDAAGNIGPRSPYDPSVEIQPAMDTIILREIPVEKPPIETCRRIFFSTEEEFITRGPEPPDGNPIISDGDLLGPGCVVFARNRELLAAFKAERDLGLDAADVIDVERRLVAFSTELGDPQAKVWSGDLLATNGAVIPNIALLAKFDIPDGAVLGLDAIHFIGDKEKIIAFLEYAAEKGREFWMENPTALPEMLEEYDIDIWFSTEGTAPKPEAPLFLNGDLLSARMGTVVVAHADFLPSSVPAGIPDRGVDFGLDAATADRSGNRELIHFSTKILYEGEPSVTDGDVLRIDNGVVCTNEDLIHCFEPKANFLGLDALSVTLEEVCKPSIEVEKKVLDPIEQAWVEQITTHVDDTVTFQCRIHNDGRCCPLYDIKVIDILPDSLEYANNVLVNGEPHEPVEIGDKELMWVFEGPLNPCETITIKFNARIVKCGEDINVQSVKAVCEETGEAVYDEDRATVVVPCVERKPDLVIKDIKLTGEGDYCYVDYLISNTGTASASASTTYLYVDGKKVASDSTSTLAAGASRWDKTSYRTTGTHTYKVCADGPNAISETNEANNCRTEELTCPPRLDIYFADGGESPGSVYHYNTTTGIEETVYTRPSRRLYSFSFRPHIPQKLYYVNANENNVYRTLQIPSGWTPEEVVYTHTTYVRDIAFAFGKDGELGLYFSEATGAGGNGKIYKIEDGKASLYYEVKLADVGGFWGGDFAFDDKGNLYLSSGNRIPASIYKVEGGKVKEIFKDEKECISGLIYADGALYYANWGTKIYRLDISTKERTIVYSNTKRTWLSDVDFRPELIG